MNITFILLLLLSGALFTFFVGNKAAKQVALAFSFTSFLVSLYFLNLYNQGLNLNIQIPWISNPTLYFALKVDGLSLAMLLLTTALTSIIILSSFGTKFESNKNFYSLVLFMSFAMVGTFLSSDAFLYYIFWELSLIPIYFIALIWGNGNKDERKQAVLKFFIYTFAGSLFMLASFIFLFYKTGSLLLNDLYMITLTPKEQFWVFGGMFLAYAIKIPLIPFHTWQANVYQKSPSAGTMLLSGIMLKMGLYSVLRWQLPIAAVAAKMYLNVLLFVGIAGVIYGSIIALKQRNLKKLLAYSSLAHVGLIAAGCYTLSLDGLRGAVLQMIAHGFVVVGLFFAAEIIERRFNTQEIAEMGGIRSQAPKFTSMFLILVLASVALPGTFNFVGEFTVLYSLYAVNVWYAIVAGTTIILGAIYMLKMFQHVMLGEQNSKPFTDITLNETLVFVLIIAVLFFFGLYPKPILDMITPALSEILNKIN